MSARRDSHDHEQGRRRSAHQPPRVEVFVTVTTKAGDPFLLMEYGLLVSRFHNAGATSIRLGTHIALAVFLFRAASAKQAALAVAKRLPRPTAGTAVMFIARRVGSDRAEYAASTEGWPEHVPEFPDPEKLQYDWSAPAGREWEVL